MVQGFRRAQQEVRSFQGDIEGIGNRLLTKFTTIDKGISAVKFVIREIAQALRFATNEASKLQDRMAEVGQLAKADTFSAQWKEFGEVIGAIALPAVTAITKELKAFNEDLANLTGAGDTLKQLRDAEAAVKRLAEEKKKEEERQNKIREGVKESTREFERLNDRAKELRDSLRTPAELLHAGQRELGKLLSENLISIETAERAAAKLVKDFQDATRTKKQLDQKREANPALEKGTSAEFSARQERIFQAQQEAEARRIALEEARRTNDLLKQVIQAIEDNPNVRLNRGVLK